MHQCACSESGHMDAIYMYSEQSAAYRVEYYELTRAWRSFNHKDDSRQQ